MPTLFFRLIGHADKAAALTEALAAVRQGCTRDAVVHAVDPASFSQVPGSPFAYWVSERIRRLFAELPPFESEGRTVRQGLATSDDFRFVRAWWEVAPERLLDGVNGPNWREDLAAFQAWCRQRTCEGKRWVLFAKGGAYSPYYSDLHLVVDWERNGEEIRGFDRAFIRNENFYFRPGLTWPLRTQLGFNMRAYPRGAIFGHKGPVAFISHGDLASYLALANSHAFGVVISLHMAFGSYEVGVVQRSPVADCNGHGGNQLDALARSAVALKQTLDTANETSHVFCVPAVLLVPGEKLAERIAAWQARIAEAELRLAEYQHAIDDIAFSLYGIDGQDRQAIEEAANSQPAVVSQDEGEMDNPEEDTDTPFQVTAPSSLVADLFSYAVGCALGRWDVRCALQARSAPDLPDPFAPLPVCSPGMLTGEDGLPLRQAPPGYPLSIAADGIIVDDPDHPDDLVRCVREGLDLVLVRP